jgi:hypothetical protein
MSYKFEYSINCPVNKDFAWRFWTDVANWAKVDPAVESVEMEGPFASGTSGVTHIRGAAPAAWKLIDVKDGESANIEITAPGAAVHFHWVSGEESAAGNALLTQQVSLTVNALPIIWKELSNLEQNARRDETAGTPLSKRPALWHKLFPISSHASVLR